MSLYISTRQKTKVPKKKTLGQQKKKRCLEQKRRRGSSCKKSCAGISLCFNAGDFHSINSVKFMSGTLISCTFYEPTLWKATSIRLWREPLIIIAKEKLRLLVTERGCAPLRNERLVRMQMWAVPLKVTWETTAARPQNPPRIYKKNPISLKIAKDWKSTLNNTDDFSVVVERA